MTDPSFDDDDDDDDNDHDDEDGELNLVNQYWWNYWKKFIYNKFDILLLLVKV